MSGVKISALPAVSSALITDIFPVVQAGVTSQETLLQVRTLFGFDSSTGLLALSKGGTNANLTAVLGAVPYSTASALALTAALTNGQILIGSTGLAPSVGTITAGTGISVTNGAGSITVATSGGGLSWSTITTATQTIAVNNGYIANRGGGVAFALPATSAVGDVFSIVGKSGTWSITQGAGQQINVGSTSTTLGAAGTLTSAAATDSANFICITANTIWQVQGGPQTAGFVLA